MSTHAIIAYESNGVFYAKYSHYGSIDDYEYVLRRATFLDFKTSVLKGDSSEPFSGFYLDPTHCMQDLGWDEDIYIENQKHSVTRRYKMIRSLMQYAHRNYADFIYIKRADNTLSVYECVATDKYAERNLDIKCYNVEYFVDYSLKDVKEEFEHALDELTTHDRFRFEEANLGIDAIDACKSVEDCVKYAERFNKLARIINEEKDQ